MDGGWAWTFFGTLRSTSYGGQTITNQRDGWGRRKKMVDPSAGTYSYLYDIYGELLEETTPKGKTTYQYDATGKVTKKTIVGDQTNLEMTYSYNTDKMVSAINGTDKFFDRTYTYRFFYDDYKRPIKTTEVNGLASFEKQLAYDGHGRVQYETYISRSLSDATSSTVKVKNVYNSSSGMLEEIRNASDSKLLWELKSHDQWLQATEVILGNGFTKKRTMDAHGLPNLATDAKGSGTSIKYALHMDYDFNAQKGILDKRKNLGLGWNETFTHDGLDRLTQVNGPAPRVQQYDAMGRIKNNDLLGSYAYHGTKKYQLASLGLNTKGQAHYQGHETQQITYNTFKMPVEVNEPNKGKVSFEYGVLGGRSHAWYGGEQSDKTKRRYHKHYSSISPVEIVEDRQVGNVKIVTYVGGDAYTAPIAHVKTKKNDVSGYHYLHRDYLGSILAVTDASGNVKEQRQFGAWGTVDKFIDNSGGNTFGHGSILDRGFTGHEHFFGVSLIHMNGRMYDALLGRFLSPDNFVQNPYNTQSFNRYGYVWNNPLVHGDPSGEIVWAAVAIGAFIGIATSAMQGHDMDRVLLGGLIGAASGLVGAGVGNLAAGGSFFSSQVLTTTAFSSGFTSGFAGGFAGGFTGSSLTSWANGDSFGTGFANGLKGGAIGGFIGGVVNGVAGGIKSMKHGGNFWNGKGATYDYMVPAQDATSVEVGDGMEYSSDYAKSFSDINFGEVEGVENLIADGSIPSTTGYKKVGDRVFSRAWGEEVKGSAVSLGKGKYDVYLYKAAFTSKEQLYLVMGHEYQHIGYDFLNLGGRMSTEHYGIRRWEYYQSKQWHWNVKQAYDNWMHSYQFYNPAYHHENFGSSIFRIINHRPILPK